MSVATHSRVKTLYLPYFYKIIPYTVLLVNKEVIKMYYLIFSDELKVLGLKAGVLYSFLREYCSQTNEQTRIKEKSDFIPITTEQIMENTNLSSKQQRKAIEKLKQFGLIEVKLKGLPAKRHFKIIKER
jgi:hypothetical protein